MTAETKQASERGRGGRMSRQRKRDAVLRLLRGEDLETASRSLGVTAAALAAWRDTFLAAGEAGLATRPAAGEARRRGRPEGPARAAAAPRGPPGVTPSWLLAGRAWPPAPLMVRRSKASD